MSTATPRTTVPSALHILTLAVLAIAQPLFDILGKHAQFFVTSNSSAADIIGLSLVASFVPGLILCLLSWIGGKISPALGRLCRHGFAFALLLLIAAQIMNQLSVESPLLFYPAAIALAMAAVGLITRMEPVRAFLDILAIALLLVPALFLYSTLSQGPWSQLRAGGTAAVEAVNNPAPVFFILIDEVPTSSLQLPDGTIDAQRFPNFARLAATSSWYRNATTVADSTEVAVPALLTGLRPDPDQHNPTASATAHPRNLFTALAQHYQVNALEPITALCPPSVCESSRRLQENDRSRFLGLLQDCSLIYSHLLLPEPHRARLPSVGQLWSGFFDKSKDTHIRQAGKQPRYQLIDMLDQAEVSSLNFVHIYLPHVPWKYLPSGKQYAGKPRDFLIEGFDPESPINRWRDDPTAISLAYQRHLLQLAYVDNYLGKLMRRIKQAHLWDKALFILVADHGLSFKPGQPRRWVSDANIDDIAPVPLFIKYPGQKRGQIDDSNVESIDLLPTIFSELGIQSDWEFDGRALQADGSSPAPAEKRLVIKSRTADAPFVELRLPVDFLSASTTPAFRQQTLGVFDAPRGKFDVSTSKALPGRRLDEMAISPLDNNVARIRNLDKLRAWRKSKKRLLPVYLRGTLDRDLAPGSELVFALNGTIRVATRSFTAEPAGRFAVILPEEFLATENNQLQVFAFDPARPERLMELQLEAVPEP